MTRDVAPICECGMRAVREGGYWVCANRECSGYGEILREVRAPGLTENIERLERA